MAPGKRQVDGGEQPGRLLEKSGGQDFPKARNNPQTTKVVLAENFIRAYMRVKLLMETSSLPQINWNVRYAFLDSMKLLCLHIDQFFLSKLKSWSKPGYQSLLRGTVTDRLNRDFREFLLSCSSVLVLR